MKKKQKKEEDEESVKIIFTCTSYLIRHFRPIFLPAVTFLHVLYFDVLRRQIEIESESYFLMYGYNAGPCIYTVLLYCVIHVYTCKYGGLGMGVPRQ